VTDTSTSAGEDVRLGDYAPRSRLVVAAHEVARARFPAIDAHNHLGRWLTPNHDWMVSDVAELFRVLDACNITAIVNLDGMWGDELEENLNRYDRAFPGRVYTFAQSDWALVSAADFGARMARQLEDSVRRGARGLKVWKTLGLRYRDAADRLIPIDDERLFDLWEAAATLDVPVLIHIADPVAFFDPLDRFNERWEELRRHPDWHFYGPAFPPFDALMEQFEHLIARHPRTTFIGAHVGCYPENLGWVSRMMDTYPNFNVDIAARVAESGLPMVYLNQVGGQDELVFDGASLVVNSDRSVAWALPPWEETVALTEWTRSRRESIKVPSRSKITSLILPESKPRRV